MTMWDDLVAGLTPMAEDSLPDLALLERPVRTRIPGGGISTAWETAIADVPCRALPVSLAQAESLVAESVQALSRWQVAFPIATALTPDMRVTIAGVDKDGRAWSRGPLTVISIDGPRTYEVLRSAICIDPTTAGV